MFKEKEDVTGTLFVFIYYFFLIDYNAGLFPDATAPFPTREMTLHICTDNNDIGRGKNILL